MIFTVERAKLLDAVSKLQRVVDSKNIAPVLKGILISAEQGKVTLISYNSEMGMTKEIYAKCDEEGDIVIEATLLADILRRMNGLQVEISAKENLVCQIKSGEAVFDIMGMAAVDFPELPTVVGGTKITINSDTFSEMVKGTLFAVAQNEGQRPVLTGIDITVKDKVLQFVAIDGYRLAIRRENVDVEEDIEFIVSGKAIGEAVKLINEETENIDIYVGKRLISFDIGGYIFISRLIEGEFVNYKNNIPAQYKQCVVMKTNELINVIDRVSLIINDFFTSPLRCYFDESEVTFNCHTKMGRSTERMEISLEGDSFEIGMNSRMLTDALKAINEPLVKIKFNGPNVGVVLTSAEEDNNDYLYMVMPMRI